MPYVPLGIQRTDDDDDDDDDGRELPSLVMLHTFTPFNSPGLYGGV